MKVESKAWNWGKNQSKKWNNPSEISYYLVHRWKEKEFIDFLDLGCGLGRHSFQFAQAGFNTFSFDLSEDVVSRIQKQANELQLSIKTYCGDMKRLPYKNNSIDCLLAYHVISHTDSNGIHEIIDEMKRVIRPNGEMYITLCSKNAWSFKDAGYKRIDDNTVLKEEDGPENGIPHFFVDDKSIIEILTGIKIESMQHVQDTIVDGNQYGSWHYFVLGINYKSVI